jgi:integrase
LTFVSDTLTHELGCGRLQPATFKSMLVAVARRQAAELERKSIMDRVSSTPGPHAGEYGERVLGAVYRLLAEHGRQARPPVDPDFLAGCGLGSADAPHVKARLDDLRERKIVPPSGDQLQRLIREHASDTPPNILACADAEHAFYRGMAAACLHTGPRWASTFEDDIELAFSDQQDTALTTKRLVPQARTLVTLATGHGRRAGEQAPATATDHVLLSPGTLEVSEQSMAKAEPIASTVSGVAERFCNRKQQLGEWTEKTSRQMQQTASLLVKTIGHDRLCGLTQADMGRYVEVLLSLPKTYGKSSRDASLSLDDLLRRGAELAPEARGLSGATLNRHLTQLGELLTYAAAQGMSPACPISLSGLRAKKKTRDRDDRAPFTRLDLTAIFAQPIWTGCASEKSRWQLGDVVIHDGLYWAPLIASYSLLRREEVCGLQIRDVVLDSEVPHFDIRLNPYRRLKTLQSTRRVPIHSELLRLGLADYIGAVAALGYDLLFPDLLASKQTALGDQLQEDWSKVLQAAIPDARARRQSFHSFRHAGNQLLADARIPLEWRQDILGHGGSSEAEERYRSETGLTQKLEAIAALPAITTDLMAYPIRLRTMVAKKLARKPRMTGPRDATLRAGVPSRLNSKVLKLNNKAFDTSS